MEDKTPVRVERIRINGLFDRFDYDIPLLGPLTVLHGPNGSGKTTILKMIDVYFIFLFGDKDDSISPFYDQIMFETPFNWLEFEFSNGVLFHFNEKGSQYQIRGDYQKKGTSEKGEIDLHTKERICKELNISNIDIIADFFIGAQRMYLFNKEYKDYMIEQSRIWPNSRPYGYSAVPSPEPPFAVIENAKELSVEIERQLNLYTAKIQQLDSEFPYKLIAFSDKDKRFSIKEIEEKLISIEKKQNELAELGLLTTRKPTLDSYVITEEKADALTLYVEDTEIQLSVLDKFAEKLGLFKNLVDKKLKYKKIFIDKENGFIFKTDEGREIPAEKLSSGEQNEVVLLYQLIFKAQPGTLVLIDEPEISLHVSWQRSVLSDLEEISKLTQCMFLIATHSPQIINGRNDLLVGLYPPAPEPINEDEEDDDE